MKSSLLSTLRCPNCFKTDWDLTILTQNEQEVREGSIQCLSCKTSYSIQGGILKMLVDLPPEVVHEKEHAESFGYLVTEKGEKLSISRETIFNFKPLFLALPEGDGSHYFKPGGSFDNQAGNAQRFYKTLEMLNLKGTERILEVGASFGWASRRFAQRGCDVVALDITFYLMTADLYFKEDGTYFERIKSDMSKIPFKDESFDIIFSHSVIHHCKDLSKLFAEFYRVLRPGGRVVALHECAFGLFEDKSGEALQEAIHEGFNENAYTLPEWKKGALKGGFEKVKLHFFSFIDDYINRKAIRNAPPSFKLRLASWVKSVPELSNFLNGLSAVPRILFRPKAWMLIAEKK
jgi:SAM-dependent methyltransferase/uncharacterized protein YbaR (Trm112 family)